MACVYLATLTLIYSGIHFDSLWITATGVLLTAVVTTCVGLHIKRTRATYLSPPGSGTGIADGQ